MKIMRADFEAKSGSVSGSAYYVLTLSIYESKDNEIVDDIRVSLQMSEFNYHQLNSFLTGEDEPIQQSPEMEKFFQSLRNVINDGQEV